MEFILTNIYSKLFYIFYVHIKKLTLIAGNWTYLTLILLNFFENNELNEKKFFDVNFDDFNVFTKSADNKDPNNNEDKENEEMKQPDQESKDELNNGNDASNNEIS